MKVNFFKNRQGYTKVVTTVIVLLMVLVFGAVIYFSTIDSVDQLDDEIYVEFGPYADTTNASAWRIELDNSPVDSSHTNVTCVNLTAGAESYPTFSLAGKFIYVAADAADNFTQVNITYTTHAGSIEGDSISPMAGNVLGLLPLIAIVLVASIIVGVVLGFGGKKGGKM